MAKSGLKIEFGSPNQGFGPRDEDLVTRFFLIFTVTWFLGSLGEQLLPTRDVLMNSSIVLEEKISF